MDLYKEALKTFAEQFEEAKKSEPSDANAMTLSTASPTGTPHARVVLLKDFDHHGFVFYTNTTSHKGQQLAANPQAALTFYWKSLVRQVHIEGTVLTVTSAEADAYWATRPRVSQIGAWASLQSQKLDQRTTLLERVTQFDKKFHGAAVPRPPHWSGYRVFPQRIEFWRAEEFRLHHRTVYEHTPAGWTSFLLYP
jgi:pyridoxamine 5'-phosphate oxidase